jgi:hypothetical protein
MTTMVEHLAEHLRGHGLTADAALREAGIWERDRSFCPLCWPPDAFELDPADYTKEALAYSKVTVEYGGGRIPVSQAMADDARGLDLRPPDR